MKKTIRLSESQLNTIIKKVVKEQEEDQYMSDVDQDKMAGDAQETPEEGDEPNYEEFISCAKGLLTQGITIGNLIDKLLDAQNEESEVEPEGEPEGEPEMEEPQLNEGKKKKK